MSLSLSQTRLQKKLVGAYDTEKRKRVSEWEKMQEEAVKLIEGGVSSDKVYLRTLKRKLAFGSSELRRQKKVNKILRGDIEKHPDDKGVWLAQTNRFIEDLQRVLDMLNVERNELGNQMDRDHNEELAELVEAVLLVLDERLKILSAA